MRNWYTNRELAGLPCMPGTTTGVRKRAEREGWKSRRRLGSKAREYAVHSLPEETKQALLAIQAPSQKAVGNSGANPVSAITRICRLEQWITEFSAELSDLKRMLGGDHA